MTGQPTQPPLDAQVTTRTHRGQESEEDRNREKHLFMAGPMVVFTWSGNGDGRVEYVSANVENEFGYHTEDFLNGTILYYHLFHPEDRNRLIVETCVFHESAQASYAQEYRLLCANGQYKWVQDFTVVERDPDGKPLHYHGYVIDITARKQAEEALNREKLLFMSGPMVVFTWKPQARPLVTYVSANVKNEFGYEAEEFLNETIYYNSLIHPEDNDRIWAEMNVHHQFKRSSYAQEYRLLCANGQYKWVYDYTVIERDADGKPLYHHGYLFDITARKRIDQVLRNNTERLEKINARLLALGSDHNKNINDLTALCGELLGADCALYNRPDGDLLCSIGQWHIPLGFKAVDAPQGHICYDIIQSNIEGAVIVRDLSHTAYYDSDPNVRMYGLKTYMGHLVKSSGQARGSLCVIYQIDFTPTEDDKRILGILASAVGNEDSHWQAEKDLVESKLWFDTILQNVSAGVIVIDDEDHRIVDCNALAIEMIGVPKEKILDSVCHRFICPAQQGKCPITDLGQTVDNAERILLTADGQSIPILKTVTRVSHKGRNYLMESFLDNTMRKRAEEKRLLLEAQLQKAQRMEAIGILAGGIAHDFNNILYAIIGNAEMSLYDLPEPSPARYPVEQVLKASFRARDLVRQILAFSRQSEKEIKPVNVHMIVKEALKLLRATLPTTIEIRQRMTAFRNTVLGDPTQIHQVLMNLCTNAHHAMLEKGGILEVNLNDVDLDAVTAAKYPGLKPGSYLKLTITDTGYGISPEIMERIFDPYFTTKDKGVGTGLGLAVVHGIVKDLGGTISVHSELGQGSTFEVFLPLINIESLPDTPAPETIPRGQERVLFVDDEEDIAGLAMRILEYLGYKVVVKTSSILALEAFKADPDRFDLIITDMTMPQMTGDRLATEMMALRPGVPIILCTGFSERISEEQAKALGIKAFVMKPLVMREIAKTIRNVLEEKR